MISTGAAMEPAVACDSDPATPMLGTLLQMDARIEKAVTVRRAIRETINSRPTRSTAKKEYGTTHGKNETFSGSHTAVDRRKAIRDVFDSLLDKDRANSPHTRRLKDIWGGASVEQEMAAAPSASPGRITHGGGDANGNDGAENLGKDSVTQSAPYDAKQSEQQHGANGSVREEDGNAGSIGEGEGDGLKATDSLAVARIPDVERSVLQIPSTSALALDGNYFSAMDMSSQAAFAYTSLTKSQARIAELEKELEERSGDCSVFSERCKTAEEAKRAFESDYWSQHERLVVAEKKSKDLDDTQAALKRTEQRLVVERNKLVVTTAELSTVTKKLKELEITSSVAAAKEREDARQVAEATARELRNEIQAASLLKEDAQAAASLLREQLSTEQKKSELVEQELQMRQSLLDESVQRYKELEIRAEQGQADLERAEKQILSLKETTATAANESMSREVDLTNKLKEEVEQRAALNNEKIKKEATISSLEAETNKQNIEIDRLTNLLSDANASRDAEMDRARGLQTELTEAKGTVSRLEVSMSDVSSKAEVIRTQRDDLRIEQQNLSAELQSARLTSDRERNEIKELKDKVTTLEKELDDERDRHDESLTKLREEHMASVKALRDRHAMSDSDVRSSHEDELRILREDLEKKIDAVKETADRKLKDARTASEKALREEKDMHEESMQRAMAASKQKFDEATELAQVKLDEAKTNSDRLLHENATHFNSIIDTLNSDLTVSKENCRVSEERIQSLSGEITQMTSKHDAAIRTMRDEHHGEMSAMTRKREEQEKSHIDAVNTMKEQQALSQADFERQTQALRDQIEREKRIYEASLAECEEQHSEALAKKEHDHITEMENFKQVIKALKDKHESSAANSELVLSLNERIEMMEDECKTLVKEVESKSKQVIKAEKHLHEVQNAQKREREDLEILRLEYAGMKTRDVQKLRWVKALETELQIRNGEAERKRAGSMNPEMNRSPQASIDGSAASTATIDTLSTAKDIILTMEKQHDEETKGYLAELKSLTKTLAKVRQEHSDLVAQCKELAAENAELSAAISAEEEEPPV